MAATKKTEKTRTQVVTVATPRYAPSTLEWSGEAIKTAETQAEAGKFTAMSKLCEALGDGDDRLKGVLDTRIDTRLGLPMLYEADSTKVRKAIEADWWRIAPETFEKRLAVWGILAGFCFVQEVWVTIGDREVPTLRVWEPEHTRKDLKTGKWYVKVASGSGTQEIEVDPLDPTSGWYLYAPHGDTNRPWVHGLYRALSRFYLLKAYAIRDWGRSSERWGMGILQLVSTLSDPQVALGKTERKELTDAIRELRHNSAIALPIGHELKVLESVARTHESFDRQIAVVDNAYATSVLGNNLTTQATSGTGNSATTQAGVSHARVRSDNEGVCTWAHFYPLARWATVNFGDPELAPWVRRDITPPVDKQAEAARIQVLSQGLVPLVQQGILTKDEAREYLGKAPLPVTETAAAGQIYQYHLTYGIATKNEVRKSLGLDPVEGGDVPATPIPVDPTAAPAEAPAP